MTARGRSAQAELPQIDEHVEAEVGVTVEELTALQILESIKGFGPQKFKELHEQRIRPNDVVRDPDRLLGKGKRGESFRQQLRATLARGQEPWRTRAVRQLLTAHKLKASVLTYGHRYYPPNVYASNNPVPVLYARGNLEILTHREAVACVGSRGIHEPYESLHAEFARVACALGFTIVSGFALGADTVGHETALRLRCRTICVMPSGLDRPFPPENRGLWQQLLDYPAAALVSEFPFGTSASQLTLRKRNKLIVAFSIGVLISQTSAQGGAMNAYRCAIEQGKPIASFESNGTAETSGNALVGEDPKASGEVFPRSGVDAEAYQRWLQKLSCST